MTIKEFLEKQKNTRSAEMEELKKRVEALENKNTESKDETELRAVSEELDELNAKKAELEAELAEINAQIAELDKPAEGEDNEPQTQRNNFNFMNKKKNERGANNMNMEERKAAAENFVKTGKTKTTAEETRSVLVSSGNIATPTEVSGINENGFAGVSSIIDLVKVVNCEGMGKNRVAYAKTDAVAATQTEGSAAGGVGTTFGFVDIAPESIAILDGISKQTKKQSPLQYEAKVREKALLALRKEAARIVTEKVLASTLVKTQTISALTETAVRDIVLDYGGDEGIEGAAYLQLCKADLVTLGKIRGTSDKKAVFEIIPDDNPNTGTIKDGGTIVKYVLNKNLTAGTLLYGQPKNIELDLFSAYEIAVSEDFAFDKLMDTIRGDAEIGAEVVAQHGITKVVVG